LGIGDWGLGKPGEKFPGFFVYVFTGNLQPATPAFAGAGSATCNMKLLSSILLLFFLVTCQPEKNKTARNNDGFQFFVGTYTGEESQGIYKYLLKPDGKLEPEGLAAKSENPSFLAMSHDHKFLLAVNEIENEEGMGTVESYKINDDRLDFISRSSSGGAHPCYVSVNSDGYVLSANYSGGNVGLLKLDKQGKLSDLLDIQQHEGRGSSERQKGTHAHSAMFEADDMNIISVDLGTNELWFSRLEENRQKLVPSYPHRIRMESGAGPRHLDFHPDGNWMYVVNELDCTVTLLKKDEHGKYQRGPSVSTLPDGYSETNYCADIHVSSDGKFLYASNRGHNSIAVFKVLKNSGLLKPVGHHSTMGDWPRNFSLSPDEEFLVVANQKSGYIVSFKRDKNTGELGYIHKLEAPEPVCIKFLDK